MAEPQGFQVLLVEDNSDELWLMGEILRSRGHTVTACQDAESAWTAFQELKPRLLLLDYILPGMDGLSLCRKIRSHPDGTDAVIVVVTGRDSPDDLKDVLRAGADDYLAKPLDVPLLEVRLAVAEQRARRHQDSEEALEARTLGLARELQQANEVLEAFASSVYRDPQSPLRTLQGSAHTLDQEHGRTLPEPGRDLLRQIIASGQQTERLIADILAYSRVSSGEVPVQEVELEEVWSEAMEQVEFHIHEREALVDVPANLPRVSAHRTTLVQVLAHLLTNAVKFVPGERTPRVVLRWEEGEEAETIRLWVEDNGPGIPAEQQERIFRAFERLGKVPGAEGTGMGLAIVGKGMERMGGRAGVASTPGEGSRFWLEIPGGRDGT